MEDNFKDIYFEKNYAKIYEKVENGEVQQFVIQNEYGKITNLFIKREIPININEKKYYDIITPYGYGGPIINYYTDKEKLLQIYEDEFKKYCIQNNIVSEFIRFHPIAKNAIDFKEVYNPIKLRKTLVTNLKDYDDPVQSQFGKSCRKNIRQALNKGITYKVTENPQNIEIFKKIYYSTMDRNNAIEFYYFDDEYFENILKYYRKNVILVEAIFDNKTIAAGFYFIYDKTIHIHLSGTLTEYLYLSPAYILRYAVTLWGKENGYNLIHHGGGRSNSEEDTLYVFKKNFAKLEYGDFYISKKIWNNEIYNKLCEEKNIDIKEEFFPAYRKEN